jgi:tRNA A37 threonylcarbamoyladenosine modification protein TsaB
MPHLSNSKQVSLAVETSGRVGSVALACGSRILAQAELSGFRRHSSELLVTISKLLSQYSLFPGDIKRIYLPRGPGSFTGIRIAVTFAKIAAFALKTEIFAVDTLESLAENVTPIIQNKTNDFLARFCSQDTAVHLLGEGLLFYQNLFECPQTIILDKTLWPAKAESVWRLGQKQAAVRQFDDPYKLTPLYIRQPEAEELWEKKQTRSFMT